MEVLETGFMLLEKANSKVEVTNKTSASLNRAHSLRINAAQALRSCT